MFPILSLKPTSGNEFSLNKRKWFEDVPIMYKYSKNETSGLLFERLCWYSIGIFVPLPVLSIASYLPLRLRHLGGWAKTDLGYVDNWSVNVLTPLYPSGHILVLELRYKTNNLKEYNGLCKGEDLTCSH